jgi:hypothetical protein
MSKLGIATKYTECQAFSPVFRIGSPRPLTHKRVLPPFGSRGGHTRLRERGWGEPIRTKGRTIWYSSYSIISLRTEWSFRLGEYGVINALGVGCLRKWLLEFCESRNLYENGLNFAKFRVFFHKIRLSLTEWHQVTATCGYINCQVKFQKPFL